MLHLGMDFLNFGFCVVYSMEYFNLKTCVFFSLETFISAYLLFFLVDLSGYFFCFLSSLFVDILLVGYCNSKIARLFLLFFAQVLYPFIFLFSIPGYLFNFIFQTLYCIFNFSDHVCSFQKFFFVLGLFFVFLAPCFIERIFFLDMSGSTNCIFFKILVCVLICTFLPAQVVLFLSCMYSLLVFITPLAILGCWHGFLAVMCIGLCP